MLNDRENVYIVRCGEVALKGQQNLFKGTAEEAADELEKRLTEAIRGQLVSDVPVGAFLSA